MQNAELKSLPPVSEMMRNAGLFPKKSLGQNFLFDLNLTRKIAGFVPNLENSIIVEVGPGPGGLTRALLEKGAKKIIAIEKDKSTLPILEEIKKVSNGKLEIVIGDALKLPIFEYKFSICSSLPYNIGTELLIRWLHFPNKIKSMTLMFQKEVAKRIIAKSGSKDYGRLAVLTSMNWNAKILFNVPNTAFVPPPKVQSAVVQLIPKEKTIETKNIEKLTAVLFGHRRKMIRSIMPDVDWKRFGLWGTERAEELSPEIFQKIAEVF